VVVHAADNRDGQNEVQRSVKLLRVPADDDSLAEDLCANEVFAVEPIEGDSGYEALLAQFEHAKLVVSVSTETAFRCSLSRAIAVALATRLKCAENALSDIELATQEAIGNAVLHGNLALPTLRAADQEDLERRVREIEIRLKNTTLARRRVTVACDWTESTLRVYVCDQGDGFQESLASSESPPTGGGRGLVMIRRLATDVVYDRSCRCVKMTFAFDGSSEAR